MDIKKRKEIDLKEILEPYLRRWKWFVATVFLAVLAAVIYIKSTPTVYKLQTSVLIKDAKKSLPGGGDLGVLQGLGGLGGMSTNSIDNEVGIFQTKTIVEDVLRDRNFQTPVYAKQTLKSVELYGKSNPVIINVIREKENVKPPKKPVYFQFKGNNIVLTSSDWDKDITAEFGKMVSLPFANLMIRKNPDYVPPYKTEMSDLYFRYDSFDNTVMTFEESLQVGLTSKDATIISLVVDFENRDKGKDFLNALVRQYNFYAINDKNLESKRTKDFVDQRIALISKELGDVETEKADYKSSNNVVDLASEARINLQLKNQSKAQLLDIGTQLELTRMIQSSLAKKGKDETLPLNIGLESEAAGNVIREYNATVLQRNKYLEEATPDNPLVKAANKQIEEMKSSLTESLQKNITSLQLARQKVEGQLGGSVQEISKVPGQEKLFRSIERQQQIKENLYLLLLQKREEAAISMEVVSEKARVIDRAFVHKKPVAPQKPVILLIAFAIGMVLPAVYIYAKTALNSKIVGREDLEKYISKPVLAEIPRISKKESDVVQLNDVTPLAEAFRILVTNLGFMMNKKESADIILITSTVKGEGKTFVSVNLSLALASLQKKVLVIGSDIRNPQLQRYNVAMKSAKGLTEFLYGDVEQVNEIIHPSGLHNLCDFIYSGSIPPNPADLLQNGRYQVLLDAVKNTYDYIILDTAPLMLVTDSFLISKFADATVYVTRSEVTERDYLKFADAAIESGRIRNVGLILNDVHHANFGYGNKYGYGYQAEKSSWWQRVKKGF